jgi:hypothetical protein
LKLKVSDQWPASLPNGSNMRRWAALKSPDSRFYLWFEPGGNLALYRARDARVLWASDTIGNAVSLRMQNDGNMVLYRETPTGAKPVWASDTAGQY